MSRTNMTGTTKFSPKKRDVAFMQGYYTGDGRKVIARKGDLHIEERPDGAYNVVMKTATGDVKAKARTIGIAKYLMKKALENQRSAL